MAENMEPPQPEIDYSWVHNDVLCEESRPQPEEKLQEIMLIGRMFCKWAVEGPDK